MSVSGQGYLLASLQTSSILRCVFIITALTIFSLRRVCPLILRESACPQERTVGSLSPALGSQSAAKTVADGRRNEFHDWSLLLQRHSRLQRRGISAQVLVCQRRECTASYERVDCSHSSFSSLGRTDNSVCTCCGFDLPQAARTDPRGHCSEYCPGIHF